MSGAIACWLALSCLAQESPALPREMAFDEPAARKSQEPLQDPHPPVQAPTAPKGNSSLIDFDWLELNPGIGFAIYSHKYLSDPGPAVTLLAHAPLPWLSPASDPTGEYFGVFASISFANIDRDLSSTVDHRKGTAMFASLGMDFSFLRDGTWIVLGRAGVLYAYYNDIADLSSGPGLMAGLTAGIQITGKMGLTFSPDFLFGDSGSLIVVNTLGLLIQF